MFSTTSDTNGAQAPAQPLVSSTGNSGSSTTLSSQHSSVPAMDKRLDTAAELLRQEHQLSTGEKFRRGLYNNGYTLAAFLVNSPFTFTVYYLNNRGSPFPPGFKKLTGTSNALLNCAFNSVALTATIKNMAGLGRNLAHKGWKAIAPHKAEAAALIAAGLACGMMSLSASLPYPAATDYGNQALAEQGAAWDNSWVQFGEMIFVPLNAVVYLPPLFFSIKSGLDHLFRSPEEKRTKAAFDTLANRIEKALLRNNTAEIEAVYAEIKALNFSNLPQLTQSALQVSQSDSMTRQTSWCALYLAETWAMLTAACFWFGTAGLICDSVKTSNSFPAAKFLTYLAGATGAENFWAAFFFHNLSNGYFAYDYAVRGVLTAPMLFSRGFRNHDSQLPATSWMAMLCTLGMLGLSGFTALAQANNGVSGVPFEVPDSLATAVNYASGFSAMSVNTAGAAFALYHFWNLLINALVTAFQACCSARQPEGYSTLYEPSSKQNKIYILEQTHSVLQQVKVNDESSFKKAIEVSPFFTQLNNASAGAPAIANADTSAGTELELGIVGGSIN